MSARSYPGPLCGRNLHGVALSASREAEKVGVTQAIPKNAKTDPRTINHHKEGKQMLDISLFTRQLALGAVFAAGLALSSASALGSPPVIETSNVDAPGRNPYQFFKNLQVCTSVCQVTTPAVPQGKRLVVQHVSAFGALTKTGTFVEVVVSAGPAVLSTFAPTVFGNPGNQGFAFDQTVLGYVDAGGTVTVFMSSDGSMADTAADFVITGYLVDCSEDACAPIVP